MSIVEKIQNLPENTVTQDDNFIMLSEALSEYHRLIQEGKLVPRKNNLENIYTTYSFHSNVNCIFRKNCASVPEERSAIPLQTEQSSAG